MKTQIAAALILLSLGSCNLSRHVQKERKETQESVSQQIVSSVQTQDKSVVTVTEKADTVVTTPATNIQAESAGTMVQSVSNGDTLRAVYDPVKNVTKVIYSSKPKAVKVKVDKVTEKVADVQQTATVSKDSTATKKVTEESKDKVTKTNWFWLYVVILIVALVVIYLLNKKFSFVKLPF